MWKGGLISTCLTRNRHCSETGGSVECILNGFFFFSGRREGWGGQERSVCVWGGWGEGGTGKNKIQEVVCLTSGCFGVMHV